MGSRRLAAVIVVPALLAAAAVGFGAGCSGPTRIAQVTATDTQGLCARDVTSGRTDCWRYTPEFPSETRYRVGECLRLTQAYKYSGPPHTTRVSCPDDIGSTAPSTSG